MRDNQSTVIRLAELVGNGDDLRTTPAQANADAELRASILAHGLLEPLVVRQDAGGTWYVVAGHRRLRALKALAEAGQIPADRPIDCTILDEAVDTTEAALAENVVRVAMNRADQVTAFARLVDAGATVEEIAVRFGVTANMVERRLRLAHLEPTILDHYRHGRITEEIAQAFATTADRKRQIEAFEWADSQYYSVHPNNIIQRLQNGMARSDMGVARFVGMDAYSAAGGASEATLFEDYSVLSDVALLGRLADEKMQAIADSVPGAEGWKWADYTVDNSINLMPYTRLHADTISTATEAEDKRLSELADFMDSYDGADWEELDEEQQQRYRDAEAEVHRINAAIEGRNEWSAEQKAASGVLLHIKHDGSVGRFEGLVREGDPVPGRDDPPAADETAAAPAGGADSRFAGGSMGADAEAKDAEQAEKKKGYSQGLRESITELRNAVLRDALCGAPDVARDLLTFNLLLGMKAGYDDDDRDYSHHFYPDPPLSIRRETPQRLPVQGATGAMNAYLEPPKLDLPWFDKRLSVGELFERYRGLDSETKDRLTAQVVARLMYSRPGGDGTTYDCHAAIENELAPAYATELLSVCPQTCWSEETIWNRLRKDQIIDECRPRLGDEWAKEAGGMKKKALAEDAATRMREHPHWLPKGFQAADRPEREPESA